MRKGEVSLWPLPLLLSQTRGSQGTGVGERTWIAEEPVRGSHERPSLDSASFRPAPLLPRVSEHSRPSGLRRRCLQLCTSRLQEAPLHSKLAPTQGGRSLQSSPLACGVQPPGAPCAILDTKPTRHGPQLLPSLTLHLNPAENLQGCTGTNGCPGHPRSLCREASSMEGFGSGGAPVSSFVLKHPRCA